MKREENALDLNEWPSPAHQDAGGLTTKADTARQEELRLQREQSHLTGAEQFRQSQPVPFGTTLVVRQK